MIVYGFDPITRDDFPLIVEDAYGGAETAAHTLRVFHELALRHRITFWELLQMLKVATLGPASLDPDYIPLSEVRTLRAQWNATLSCLRNRTARLSSQWRPGSERNAIVRCSRNIIPIPTSVRATRQSTKNTSAQWLTPSLGQRRGQCHEPRTALQQRRCAAGRDERGQGLLGELP